MRNTATRGVLALALFLLTASTAPARAGEPPSGADIAARAFAVHGGDDGAARLTFVFTGPGQAERRLGYDMLWKRYGDGPFDTKVVLFQEVPATHKGMAYMGWFARPGAGREDEEWIYLPDLRAVRKMVHKGGHEHHHEHADEEEFEPSLLTRAHLEPLPPELGEHRLLRTEPMAGKEAYVVESVPRKDGPERPFTRAVRWIAQDTFLTLHAEYYQGEGDPVTRVDYDWKRMGGEWVWRKVTATRDDGARTVLEVEHTGLNTGLDDSVFSERTLGGGPRRFF